MNLDVIFSWSEVTPERVKGRIAVVIDVLRATSVMVTALNNGALKVIPVLTPDEAFEYKKNNGKDILLVGERHADIIEGFDFSNSPLDMSPISVTNQTVVMTTTNGTKAIRAAEEAKELYIASFLNARSTAQILAQQDDVVLIASGSNGSFTMEDTLCMGYITNLLKSELGNALGLTDAALAARQLFINAQQNLHALASQGTHYRLLKSKGLDDDIRYCFSLDSINLVCYRKNGVIVALK